MSLWGVYASYVKVVEDNCQERIQSKEMLRPRLGRTMELHEAEQGQLDERRGLAIYPKGSKLDGKVGVGA